MAQIYLTELGEIGYYFAVAGTIVCVAEMVYRRLIEKKTEAK